jgi:type VI secretion system VasI/ImpG family protein
MDPRLLSAYEAELEYLRETAREFGVENEEVAGRLGLKTPNDPDPYVERLLEGVAFLAARVRLKLDDQFPEFTQHLLQAVQPDYLAPTPSICVVGLEVDGADPVLVEGASVPRGTELSAATPGHDTPCLFVTGHDVDLLPLEIESIEYLPNRAAAAAASPSGFVNAEAGLKIRFKTTGGASLSSIKVGALPLFIKGSESIPGLLYRQILGDTVMASARAGDAGAAVRLPPPQPHGFDDNCALLPTSGRSFRGYRVLREYFACPERFMFFRLDGLGPVFAAGGESLEIVLLFDRVAEPLIDAVSADNLRLFCTPAVNLFERPLGPIQLRKFDHEQQVTPDRTKPLDFEVYRLLDVKAQGRGGRAQTVSPLHALGAQFHDWGGALCYVTRIRSRKLSTSERAARGASEYIGTETFITLAAPGGPERTDQVQQLSIRALLTNRELPELLKFTARQCEFRTEVAAIKSVTVHRAPTRPRPPLGLTDAAWKVIGHLTANYASLVNDPQGDPELLRSQLRLYGFADDPALRRQVAGIRKVSAAPVTRRIQVAAEPGGANGARERHAFVRGQQVTLELDDAAYDRGRMFLFSAVIDRFLAEFVSVNSFIATAFKSPEQGDFAQWPPRTGQRPTI